MIFLAALAVGCGILAVIGWDEPADGNVLCANGGNLRPYAGLDVNQLPCLLHTEFDGAGHAIVSGYNPGGIPWTAATFHVPNPDRWLEDQELTDQVAIPPGDFGFVLNCAPGAAQVDIWAEGNDEPYAAATTLSCGEQASFAAPAPTTTPVVDTLRGDDTPTGGASAASAGVGGGQEPATSSADEPVPAPTVNTTTVELAPAPEVAVAGVAVVRQLPDTGAPEVALLVGAGVICIAFGHVLTRFQKRSGS